MAVDHHVLSFRNLCSNINYPESFAFPGGCHEQLSGEGIGMALGERDPTDRIHVSRDDQSPQVGSQGGLVFMPGCVMESIRSCLEMLRGTRMPGARHLAPNLP